MCLYPYPSAVQYAHVDLVADAHEPMFGVLRTIDNAVLTRVVLFPSTPQMAHGVEPDDVTFSSLIATTRDGSEQSPERGRAVSVHPPTEMT